MVVAHYNSTGHRGHAELVATIRRLFYVDHLADGGGPYAPRWHAKEGNEGIHFDYLYMGEALSGAKYVLVLKDDLALYRERR
ncbi:hypothetical protein H257_02847 [Aphanomyces astaci]|uniref:Uncharacterized protein n=1 Tax=Aphanomyces astaci TaxID=112090 RepID=W4H051_APHAT|nr:hypothetical protein H257_02847 [Aphanomyces astaci]ETV84951.1 hypothetical protein H257_02847 [Aphanomyces astaci]|eukprot:XP_009824969.1 hypothetical protein H257_02847 [Aphanomyces astaci]